MHVHGCTRVRRRVIRLISIVSGAVYHMLHMTSACARLQVQVRRGTWAAPMVLGKAYDIRRMTAEQQAARAALQSLGLEVHLLV